MSQIGEDQYREDSIDGPNRSGIWVQPPSGRSPGIWAVRLRFEAKSKARVPVRVAAEGAFELFLDSTLLSRGWGGHMDHPESYGLQLELDIDPGRHELFAYIWSFERGGSLPRLMLAAEDLVGIATASAPWKIARLSNIEFFERSSEQSYRVLGEPTGPGGMDRGAKWEDPVRNRDPILRGFGEDRKRLRPPIPGMVTNVVVDGEHGGDFESVLGVDGMFQVEAGTSVSVRYTLPQRAYVARIRASGGEGSSIEVETCDDPRKTVLFEPRGFRQDFSTFNTLFGGTRTMTLHGGTRGLALFGLEFWEIPLSNQS